MLLLGFLLLVAAGMAGDAIGQWRMHREAQHLRRTLAQLEAQRADLAHVRMVLHAAGIQKLDDTGSAGLYQGFTQQYWGFGDCRVFVTFTVDNDQRLQSDKVDEGCQSF